MGSAGLGPELAKMDVTVHHIARPDSDHNHTWFRRVSVSTVYSLHGWVGSVVGLLQMGLFVFYF